MFQEQQLDLFSYDIVRVSQAYEILGRFDFQGAQRIFEEVLAQNSNNSLAFEGITLIHHWQDRLDGLKQLDSQKSLSLWKKVKEYPFGPGNGAQQLRKGIIEKLIEFFKDNPLDYFPPDLCLGFLYLQTGDYKKAEVALRTLLHHYSHHVKLITFLGNALWLQGRQFEARTAYTKALLLDPSAVSLEYLKDEAFIQIIDREGLGMAPHYGWIEGLLPLINIEKELSVRTTHQKIYSFLFHTEKARQKGDHEMMIKYRKKLKEEAKEFFDIYMEHLRGLLL